MTKQQQAAHIIAVLEEAYPSAICSLEYEIPYQLLIATRLAAQCTDERVNKTTQTLFVKYPTLASFANAKKETLAEDIRSCGLGNTKARDIVAAATMLLEEYNSIVPDSIDELLKLPGVGRKTANLIIGDVYHQPAVVCDTHCIRITNLLGLTTSINATIVERQLREILPPDKSNDFCHRLVLHGRAVCKARNPACPLCVANPYCDYFKEKYKTPTE